MMFGNLYELPKKVTIYEVGPRDGLQNEKAVIPTSEKVKFILDLVSVGLPLVETTSFVSPKWVPQLGDAAEVLANLPKNIAEQMPVLVPNLKGLERAIESGVQHIAVFASATESFAKNNLNSTYLAQFETISQVTAQASLNRIKIRGYVSMCFGDPWEGHVSSDKVVDAVKRLLDLGVYEVSLGDTIGVATAGQVKNLIHLLNDSGVSNTQLAVHFHDTYGQALSNAFTALQHGITTFDSSAGGLGGCPYAVNATGNLATEDLLWLLNGLGIETSVNLDALVKVSLNMAKLLGRKSPSRVVNALAGGD